jgi:hypothetical protein
MREEPVYEQKPVAIGAAWTPLLDPSGTGGAMASPRPVRLWGVRPEAACSLALPLAPPGARLGCS